MSWKSSAPIVAVLLLIVIVCLALLFLLSYIGQPEEVQDHTYEIYDAQCPNGHYWVEVEGEGGGFIGWHFELRSELMMSYTVQYLDGNMLKTVIFSSQEESVQQGEEHGYTWTTDILSYVFLVEDANMTPTIRIITHPPSVVNSGHPRLIEYIVTLPDPKLLPQGG